jgi:hypothetical protein
VILIRAIHRLFMMFYKCRVNTDPSKQQPKTFLCKTLVKTKHTLYFGTKISRQSKHFPALKKNVLAQSNVLRLNYIVSSFQYKFSSYNINLQVFSYNRIIYNFFLSLSTLEIF